MRLTKRKGVMIVWLEILVAIFVIGLFYVLFSYVIYGQLKPLIIPQLNALNSTTLNTTGMQQTINMIDMVWTWWPLILICGLIVYGFVASQKREPDQYYY